MKKLSFATLLAVLIAILAVTAALAAFNNGDFEAGTFNGWTQEFFLNYGLTGSPPFDGSSIARTPGGSTQSVIMGPFPARSQTDPFSPIQYPASGSYTARINDPTTGRLSNTIKQTVTVDAGDVSVVDGLVHLRFIYAAVMQDPGHAPAEQPWFYVSVKNDTKGTVLYDKFSYVGDANPWLNGTVTGWKYLDWIQIKIDGGMDVGDQITLEAIAADCSLGGHAGYVYIDEVGFRIPAPSISASGPAQVPTLTTPITYDFDYSTVVDQTNAVITIPLPAGTAFASVTEAACSYAAGTVTCNFASLAAGASGTFDLTVNINPGAAFPITLSGYTIQADDTNTSSGPAVVTNSPPAPTITGLTPNIGPTAGGTSVVITGTNFTGATGVTFDGLAGTCTVNSNTQITCSTPAHPVGLVDVVVISPALGNGTLPGGFTYIAPLPDGWTGSGTITSDQPIVTIGRPHIGSPAQVSAYAGFGSGSNTAYLPMLFKRAFDASYNSAFYIQNASANTATFAITYYNLDGSMACAVNDSLGRGASEGYWVPAETCLPNGWVGGAVITSDNPITVVGRPHVGSEVMSYNALQSGSTTAHLPMLFRAAFGGTYNGAIYIQNTSNAAATFTMSFYNEAGALTCVMTGQTIAARGIRNYWMPTQTCVPANWSGGATITSDQNVVALARIHVGAQISTYAGFNEAGSQAYVPMVFRRAFVENYASALYIQNVTGNSATVTISYRQNDGTETCSETLTLAARAAGRLWTPTQACIPNGWAGGALITSTQNVVVVGRSHLLSTGEVASYPGRNMAFNQAFLPMLFKTAFGNYESAMYVQNVSASPANIVISFNNAAGVTGCVVQETLPAFASKGYWLPNVCKP